jgi:hypothetical protein
MTNVNKSKMDDKDKLVMIKANDNKDHMERESLCRYYDEFKSITSKILDIFKAIDEEPLKKIEELTSTDKSFLYEMEVDKFIGDIRNTLNVEKIKERASSNNLKKYEMKIFDNYLEFLINIFKDELSLSEYNLEAIFKSKIKEMNNYLKEIRKAQTVNSTIEMGDNMVKINLFF